MRERCQHHAWYLRSHLLHGVRHVEGIERNWAPYWSLWESEDRPDGRTRYSIFFNFIAWQTDAPETPAAVPAEKGD